MPEYQISAIRPATEDADRRIDALRIEGTLWPIDKVIEWIRSGTHRFWVKVGDRRVRVVVGRHWTSGHYFLTTEGEGFPPTILLAMRHAY